MSTVKTDAITAVSTNGDLSLDGLGTGGVSIASTLKMTKGGDISSASPLVIDVDGNYFDVTGTTNFSAMTVESGNFFMLQFDGALTITHGSGIELPGAANLTTATGDRLICYATAANTVEVMSVETEAAASAGGFTLGTEQATTSGSSITFSGIPSGVTMVIISFEAVGVASSGDTDMELGDSGGIETSGYIGASGQAGNIREGTSTFRLADSASASMEQHGAFILVLKDSTNNTWALTGSTFDTVHSTARVVSTAGTKSLSGVLTQIKISANISAATFDAGSVNIMYQ